MVPVPAPSLSYSRLNLFRNPFGELDLAERQRLAVGDLEGPCERLARPGTAFQVVGDEGRGKTSHLLIVRRRFPFAPYVHVGEGEWPRLPRASLLIVDEAQRLPSWRRRRLFRRRGHSLALASHEDHEGELRAAGLEVITLRPEQEASTARLGEIFAGRIEACRRRRGAVPRVPARTIERLRRRFAGDVRAMEGALYRALSELREVSDVEV